MFEPDDDTSLSRLHAAGIGICDDVKTVVDYQRCGLAKYLMATCFQDWSVLGDDGRGVDVTKDWTWRESPERRNANKYCKTIVYLTCASRPHRNCISYLRAASAAGFDLLFPFNPRGHKSTFKLGERLESEFHQSYNEFIFQNGARWYFCKCKEGSEQPCLAMASNEHETSTAKGN